MNLLKVTLTLKLFGDQNSSERELKDAYQYLIVGKRYFAVIPSAYNILVKKAK
ncbi:hypothetical protein D3C86_2185240 [compost metagenome]